MNEDVEITIGEGDTKLSVLLDKVFSPRKVISGWQKMFLFLFIYLFLNITCYTKSVKLSML